MQGTVDVDAWRQVLLSSWSQIGTEIAAFLPHLAGAALILLLGWLVARLVRAAAGRTLQRVGLDRAGEHLRLTATLRGAGITTAPSAIVAQLLFWIVLLGFGLASAETLGLRAVAAALGQVVGFLPDVFAAALILLAGAFLGRLVRNVVNTGVRVAGLSGSTALGAIANGVVLLVVAVLALEQLGVETRLLVTVITALVVTLSLTAGAAFAMGSRSLIGHILAGHYLRQSLPTEGTVSVRGRRGTVERVGPVDTVFRDAETSWSIPNAALLEEVVDR